MSVSQDMTIPIFLASAPIVSKITPGTLLVKLVTVSQQNLSFFVCICACSGGGGGVVFNTCLDSFSTIEMMIFSREMRF